MSNSVFKKRPRVSLPVLSNLDMTRSLVVDQTMCDSDFLSPAGFLASDIYLIEKARTKEQFEFLSSRLREVGVQSVDNSKFSDSELIKTIMPSYIQTPSEISRFADYYNATHPITDDSFDDSVKVPDEVKETVSSETS